MKPERIMQRLAKVKKDCAELRMTGTALGDELPRGRIDVLRNFLSEMARLQGTSNSVFTKDPYANGYVMALRDVLHAYIAVVAEEQDMDHAARKFLEHGFDPVFRQFELRSVMTVGTMSVFTEMSEDIIKPKLDLLQAMSLVELNTPSGTATMYRLSSRGDKVWARMKKLKDRWY